MSMVLDLAGKKIGRLTVLQRYGKAKRGGHAKWECMCECGNRVVKTSEYLTHSPCPSCGCYKSEITSKLKRGNIKGNYYIVDGDIVTMYTNNTGAEFFFDVEDLDKVLKYTWMENHRGYIVRTASYMALHRYLVGEIPDGMVVDHKDRDKKNNCKSNLRIVTQQENTTNRSINKSNQFGVAGVHKNNSKFVKYVVTVGANGRLFKGYYKTLEEAIRARLSAEKEIYGDNAPQKHLFKEYGIE